MAGEARRIIFINYLQKDKTTTVDFMYYAYLLRHLSEEIKEKRRIW